MRGITIILNGESVHTGNDLGLVQEVKEIDKPDIQSYTVEVPGRNGLLNLTKGLTGKVVYSDRSMKFQYFGSGSRAELLRLDTVMSYYHGETVRIIDDDYPDHFYEGEVSVESEFNSNYITITLTVDAQPFRLKNERTVFLYDLSEIVGTAEFYVPNESIDAIPTITVKEETTITRNNKEVTLSAGTYEIADFVLFRGDNQFFAKGNDIIEIEYQEGAI